ncbi:PucR family transcriptional regulator [Kitasatospora sp. NPDC057904]|uniref:PucR family transcriptional regulator n=1 Tax=unclassified Kitasatospora TaxID=2633591 RepID=UPI0036DF998F
MEDTDAQRRRPPQAASRSLIRTTASFLRDIVEIADRYERGAYGTATRSGERWAGVEQALQALLGEMAESVGPAHPDASGKPQPRPGTDAGNKGATVVQMAQARRHLADGLTGRAIVPSRTLNELAGSVGWAALPTRVQLIVVAVDGTLPGPPTPNSIMTLLAPGELCVLIPDPGQRISADLQRWLNGRTAAVGPSVKLAEAGESLRWARRLLAFQHTKRGPGPRVAYVEEHLSTILLLQDEALANHLVEQKLGVMDTLTNRQKDQLSETLMVWLIGGGATIAAKVLGVHPQTIRYRVRKLERMFGPALEDPRSRFELELALRLRQLARVSRRHNYHGEGGPDGQAVAAADAPPG